MYLKLKLIHTRDFLRTKATGELDLKQSKQMISEIASTLEQEGDHEILIDLREAETHLSYANLIELLKEFRRIRSKPSSRRIAVLTKQDHDHEKVWFLETSAYNRGFQLKPFTDFEKAIYWLSDSSD